MRRLLALTCAIVLVDTLFHAALAPLNPYFAQRLGISTSAIGVINGAFGAGVLAGSAPAGYLVAKIGVRPSALAGFGIFSATSLAFGFAAEPWVLIAARFGEGFGSALSWVAAFTWLITSASEQRRGEMIGMLLSGAVVGAVLGPVVGSMAATFGVAPVFSAVAAIGVAISAWIYLTPAPPLARPRRYLPMLKSILRPRMMPGLWFVTLSPLLFGALIVLAPLQFSDFGWGAAAIGAVFFAGAACEAVAQPLIGRWSDRAGYWPPLRAGLTGSVALLLLLPWVRDPLVLAPVVLLSAVLFNISVTPGTALFSRQAGKVGVDQAIVFGTTNLAWAAGSTVGAPLAGYLTDLRGDALPYLLLATVCALTLLSTRRAL